MHSSLSPHRACPGVKRQRGCVALPSSPISGSLRFRNEASTLQSGCSCKIALFLLSPLGKKAEQHSLPQHILAGELREGNPRLGQVRRAGGWQHRCGLSGLSPTSHSCFPFPGTLQWALGGERLSPSCGAGLAAPRTMPVFLCWPGQLLAVVVLVLEPPGSLGECRSPVCFLCFCGSTLLTDQIWNDWVSKSQRENFL